MTPSQLKPGTWLVIREPLDDREYRAQFVEHLPSLGYGDPALTRLCCAEWVGQPGADDAGCCTFTDSELIRRCRVLLDETEMLAHQVMHSHYQRRSRAQLRRAAVSAGLLASAIASTSESDATLAPAHAGNRAARLSPHSQGEPGHPQEKGQTPHLARAPGNSLDCSGSEERDAAARQAGDLAERGP